MIVLEDGAVLILETCTEVTDYWINGNEFERCPVCGAEPEDDGYILHQGKRPVLH